MFKYLLMEKNKFYPFFFSFFSTGDCSQNKLYSKPLLVISAWSASTKNHSLYLFLCAINLDIFIHDWNGQRLASYIINIFFILNSKIVIQDSMYTIVQPSHDIVISNAKHKNKSLNVPSCKSFPEVTSLRNVKPCSNLTALWQINY